MLAVEEGKVVGGEWLEWKGRGDVEAAEEKDEEVSEWWRVMVVPEDGGWKFGVLGRDNGREVRLVLEKERELTSGWDLQEQDFSNLITITDNFNH